MSGRQLIYLSYILGFWGGEGYRNWGSVIVTANDENLHYLYVLVSPIFLLLCFSLSFFSCFSIYFDFYLASSCMFLSVCKIVFYLKHIVLSSSLPLSFSLSVSLNLLSLSFYINLLSPSFSSLLLFISLSFSFSFFFCATASNYVLRTFPTKTNFQSFSVIYPRW